MSTDAPADPASQLPAEPANPRADQGESALPTADAAYWEAAAASFDDEPDHGLRDPAVRAAWAARLRSWLPSAPAAVLDLGCGTGSLALLAAEQGHRVTGVDRSPRMIAQARGKLAGRDAAFLVADAAEPPVGEQRFDVVLVRHVLWALPDPAAALRRWAGLLAPGGRLVLVEGRWGEAEPVGIPAGELTDLVGPLAARTRVEHLSHDPVLWGKEVTDERYVLIAELPRRHTEVVDVHLVLRRGEEVLLARRSGTGYADGLLHAPSGHAEDGEDVREAMIREAAEEIGLRLTPGDLRVGLVMQHCAPPPARPGSAGSSRRSTARAANRGTANRTSARSWRGTGWMRCRTTWSRTAAPVWTDCVRGTASCSTGTGPATPSPTTRPPPPGPSPSTGRGPAAEPAVRRFAAPFPVRGARCAAAFPRCGARLARSVRPPKV